jgi:hypothetical protein
VLNVFIAKFSFFQFINGLAAFDGTCVIANAGGKFSRSTTKTGLIKLQVLLIVLIIHRKCVWRVNYILIFSRIIFENQISNKERYFFIHLYYSHSISFGKKDCLNKCHPSSDNRPLINFAKKIV